MKKFGRWVILSVCIVHPFFSVPMSQAAAQNDPDPNASIRKAADPLAEFEKVKKINNDLAIQHFTGLIEANPKEADNYVKRGKAFSGNREFDKAENDYNKAIKLDPKLAEAYVGRAVLRLLTKEYGRCWEDVHKAESLGGEFWPSFMDALKKGSGRGK